MQGEKTVSAAESVRAMYDESAEFYDKVMDDEITHSNYAETFARLSTAIAEIPGVLIDAPCGSGHMLRLYRDEYEADRPLVGVDLSPRMIEISAGRLGENAELQVGDIRDLADIQDGCAAAVVCYFAFHHLDKQGIESALREWHRVLTDGGRVVVATWEGDGYIDYGDESDLLARRYSLDDMSALLEASGFEVSYSAVETIEDMGMDAVYIDGTKGS